MTGSVDWVAVRSQGQLVAESKDLYLSSVEFRNGSRTALSPRDRPRTASSQLTEQMRGFDEQALSSLIGHFQNWQANCSLVLFEGFAKNIYKNSKSWGFHFLT